MHSRSVFVGVLAVSVVVVLASADSPPDRVASEISRWSTLLAGEKRTDPLWVDATKAGQAVLTQAQEELRQGRRLLALERLAVLGQNLGGALYAFEKSPDDRKDLAAFEADWKRVGVMLEDVVSPTGGEVAAAAGIRPALARALAELSISQAREFYAASLEYGRNTEPQYGFFYLGAAQAQRNFLGILRALPAPRALREPQLRGLRPEIDALQADLLAAYRPPASIDRHSEFIVASSALKEAREQDAAGHRHAALLRYLQAAQRTAMLRAPVLGDATLVQRRLDESAARLATGTDHTIGRFFIERAQSSLASTTGSVDAAAAALAADVLPRYLAALEPAPARAPDAKPRVTVTLVRWPFT